jgi:Ice-binding-like/IPTL-CTERM motif
MNAQTTSNTRSQHVVPRVAKSDSRLSRNHPGLLASLGLAALLLVSAPALAQSLGAAQSFAILGGSGVNANGTGSVINGDVGIAPAAATFITGIPANATVTPPFANHGNDAFAIAARASTLTLFNSLNTLGGATPILPALNGQSLVPGTYSTGAATLTSGTPLILTGAGTYIFQLGSLTTDVGSSVTLIGVDPCNVFWQVDTLAALNGATFPGNIVAGTGVHLVTAGASLIGRALVQAAGDVTLAGTNTVGGCSFAGPGLATPTLSNPLPLPSVPLGSAISDTKTLSGAAIPTGTITFNLFGPNDATCTGPVIFTSTVPVNGNGTFTSASFTPLAIGTFRFIANFSGDANNAPTANACNAPNENVVVAAVVIGPNFGIPTLSEWAMIMLAALLAFAGFAAMRRRAR